MPSARRNRIGQMSRVATEQLVSPNYVDETQQYLYGKNYEEIEKSANLLRVSKDPSLLTSFGIHITAAI